MLGTLSNGGPQGRHLETTPDSANKRHDAEEKEDGEAGPQNPRALIFISLVAKEGTAEFGIRRAAIARTVAVIRTDQTIAQIGRLTDQARCQ